MFRKSPEQIQQKLDKELARQVYSERPDDVESLLDRGANPDTKRMGTPVVYEAIRWSDYRTLEHLKKAGADFTVEYQSAKILDYIAGREYFKSNSFEKIVDTCFSSTEDFTQLFQSEESLVRIFEQYDKHHPSLFKNLLQNIPAPRLQLKALRDNKNNIKKFEKAVNTFNVEVFHSIKLFKLLEEMARDDQYHDQLKMLFLELENKTEYIERLRNVALNHQAKQNLSFLSNFENEKWTFTAERPSSISRFNASEIPGFSLKEIFNFKGQGGERISILTHIETATQTPQRESFSIIDDKDLIQTAAQKLIENGGRLPDESDFKPKIVKPVSDLAGVSNSR